METTNARVKAKTIFVLMTISSKRFDQSFSIRRANSTQIWARSDLISSEIFDTNPYSDVILSEPRFQGPLEELALF